MNKIAWEKWVDFDEEDLIIDNSDEFEEDEEEFRSVEIEPIMIRTPLGVYSPFEPMTPSKMFDCWVMHTNFDISDEIVRILESVDGIEVLKVMSRYRVFIGIGKMFLFSEVREVLQSKLCESEGADFIENETMSKLDNIFSSMGDSKKWAIFLGKDGTVISISVENDLEEYESKLHNMTSMKNGNIFIYSEN